MALKFFWNGIKDDGGKLQTVIYSAGALIKHPEGTITIYKKRSYPGFTAGIRDAFKVENGTDIYTDYFESDSIRVLPDHPLYAQVRAACDKAHARGH